ncbi:hypothetical protein PanWU01x14_151110 [Parasponia andersonii]|uniref:Aminotransferase-like mobile domain containing protein n=1 Tax=Parasponia andersonii TaxID=3476 RepID=A0A2P5CI36_PARAD|nr:hypothetical protein PanWU01x14_151110 [Parasponia andersonii]
MGGMWRAWEIWAREYFPSLRLIKPSEESIMFPRALRWKQSEPPLMEVEVMLHYYRLKLNEMTVNDVQWEPWGDHDSLPIFVKESISSTEKRIVLEASFFNDGLAYNRAVEGKPWYHFIETNSVLGYSDYRKRWLSPASGEQSIQRALSTNPYFMDDEFAHVEDEFQIPPWSLLVPTLNGEAKVGIVTAKKLLRMTGAMQQLLIEHLTNTTDTLRNYVAIIHNLRNQLHLLTERENNFGFGLERDTQNYNNRGHNIDSEAIEATNINDFGTVENIL